MALTLYAHPFSSYCQKVLVALHENAIPFDMQLLDHADHAVMAQFESLWPIRRFPILVDAGRTVIESSIIIEHLQIHYPDRIRLIPHEADDALAARSMDRFFDNYLSTPQQKLVIDRLRQPDRRDPQGVDDARAMLDTAYRWLDDTMADREWATGPAFTLADCAAAPALFYADWSHPIDSRFANVRAYRERLLARPSFARAVDEARPYRSLFPLGAPDRD